MSTKFKTSMLALALAAMTGLGACGSSSPATGGTGGSSATGGAGGGSTGNGGAGGGMGGAGGGNPDGGGTGAGGTSAAHTVHLGLINAATSGGIDITRDPPVDYNTCKQ
jgi:hypothetical protein